MMTCLCRRLRHEAPAAILLRYIVYAERRHDLLLMRAIRHASLRHLTYAENAVYRHYAMPTLNWLYQR